MSPRQTRTSSPRTPARTRQRPAPAAPAAAAEPGPPQEPPAPEPETRPAAVRPWWEAVIADHPEYGYLFDPADPVPAAAVQPFGVSGAAEASLQQTAADVLAAGREFDACHDRGREVAWYGPEAVTR